MIYLNQMLTEVILKVMVKKFFLWKKLGSHPFEITTKLNSLAALQSLETKSC